MRAQWRSAVLGPALVVLGASVLVAVPAGLAWWGLAPRVRGRVEDAGIRLDPSPEAPEIAADGIFAAVGLVAGVVLAVVATRLAVRSAAGVAAVLGALAVGGLAGSAIAWWLGSAIDPQSAREAAAGLLVGARVELPLSLGAVGVVIAWPLAAVIGYAAAEVAFPVMDAPPDEDRPPPP